MAFFNKIFPGIGLAGEKNSKKENLAKTKSSNLMKKVPVLLADDGNNVAAGKTAPRKIQKVKEEKLAENLARIVKASNAFANEYESRINKVLELNDFNDEQLAVIEEEINPVFDGLWSFVRRYEQGECSLEIFNGLRACMQKAEAFLSELSQFQTESKQIEREEQAQSSSEELFQVCQTLLMETFQSLDDQIRKMIPDEDELPEEAYFLDKLGQFEYDNLSDQEAAEITEMLSILQAEISKSWQAKKREFAAQELAQKALQKKRKIVIQETMEIEDKPVESNNPTEVVEKKEADGLMRLKNLAEKIRNRVHYIDKNDFAKKAVSSKDKVYDFDLRKDLAYFLANNQFLTEVEAGVKIEKTAADFQKFETLILQAAGNEKIGYVVYGERTYIVDIVELETQSVERAAQDAKLKTQNVQRVKQVAESVAQNVQQEKQDRKSNLDVVKVQPKKRVDFPLGLVNDFKRNASVFAENLKKESQEEVTDIITQEEQAALIRIFTKRFLREVISEKESLSRTKIFQSKSEKEKFVEFICDSIF